MDGLHVVLLALWSTRIPLAVLIERESDDLVVDDQGGLSVAAKANASTRINF